MPDVVAAAPATVWTMIGVGLDITVAVALASVAIWLLTRRDRFGSAGTAMVCALFLTAFWSLADAATAASSFVAGFAPSIAESVRNLGWLAVMLRLFGSDGRHSSLAIRPVIVSLAFVELLHLAIDYGLSRLTMDREVLRVAFEVKVLFRLLVTVGGLVLVHNLYASAPRTSRAVLRWVSAGLAALWAFDLNLYTMAYLAGSWPGEIAALRGIATGALAGCIAIAAAGNRDDLRLRPSRAVTFRTFSLLVIGVYLVAMVAVVKWLSYVGGDFARLIELTFLTLASALALVVLPSRRVGGRLKVMLAKHFFRHRYDYREEWLRFTRTIGNGGERSAPLGERAVQSIADVFESPAGLLLSPGDQGELTLAARWNWPDIEVPATAISIAGLRYFERTGYIADLDAVRAGESSGDADLPGWLLDHPQAWALIPLVHYERLVGIVVLARPQLARKFDWEDFDLLRVIGQQIASHLAENASQEALAESARFEDFHRRIAFVMHDIKNLASQFSLLARNAELHAEKAAFRADMLVTLRNSSDKLNALLARLSRYGSGGGERLEQVSAHEVLAVVMDRFRATTQVVLAESHDVAVTANRHSLEQVLMHLVQNAIDASRPDSPVFLSLAIDGDKARFEVLDSGTGMSADFVRNRLFKPFLSTKTGGFGIGAFEARELVRAMRGRLDVESREGLGSRILVRLPLVAFGSILPALASPDQKVAS